MPTEETPLLDRVASCISQLSAAAKELNSISDDLGKSISEIDIALKKLNLGVTVWITIQKNEGLPNHETWFWSEDIGYAKVSGNWGICLRKISGDYTYPDQEDVESWLFNDAPRTLRISAIGKVPDLLEKLSEEAVKTTEKLRATLDEADAVAKAVTGAAGLSRPRLVPQPKTYDVGSWRNAVISALVKGGHGSAAQMLNAAEWTTDGSTLRMEAPGVGKKMLGLIVNPAAETIIRQELQRLGAPASFVVAPGLAVNGNSDSIYEPGTER
jgi:hypothetical protein